MEIMIVIALVGMVIAFGVTRLGGKNREVKTAIRRFSVLGKTLHTKAKLLNRTYRIVIDMKAEADHSYWVESSTGKVTLLSDDKKEELERLTTIQREQLTKKNEFSKDSSMTKAALELPKPLFFKSVEYTQRKDAVTEGQAYIHFFPQGLVEEAAIHITDGEDLNWTLAFHPITGKVDIISQDVPLEEISQIEER